VFARAASSRKPLDLHTPVSKNWKYFNVKSELVNDYLKKYGEK